jgi:hypothetical protein
MPAMFTMFTLSESEVVENIAGITPKFLAWTHSNQEQLPTTLKTQPILTF